MCKYVANCSQPPFVFCVELLWSSFICFWKCRKGPEHFAHPVDESSWPIWIRCTEKCYSRLRTHFKKRQNYIPSFNAFKRLIDKFHNPRPAGVWLVTRPAGGGGGGAKGPLRSPKLLDRFPNFKRHSIALYVNYPYKVKNLTRRSLMTSQVKSKSEFSIFRAWWYRRVKFRC